MTALLSHCRPPPSMHYLIVLFSYNNSLSWRELLVVFHSCGGKPSGRVLPSPRGGAHRHIQQGPDCSSTARAEDQPRQTT